MAIDPEHVNLFISDSLTTLLGSSGSQVLDVSTPGRRDAEFVHDAIVDGKLPPLLDPFLRKVLLDDWEHFDWPFQQFLAEHGLSFRIWRCARRV